MAMGDGGSRAGSGGVGVYACVDLTLLVSKWLGFRVEREVEEVVRVGVAE